MSKKWSKNKKPRKKVAGIPNNHRKLPVGTVVDQASPEPVRGEYLALPLFGWVSIRQKTEDPLVMLILLLIRSVEDPSPRATLQIELPVFDETINDTLAALDRFGWDGRVYPIDDGWPDGDPDQLEQITGLMEQANLRATLTFPPGDQGISVQPVKIERAKGPFLMPPLPKTDDEPEPTKLAKLKLLCENPRQFYNPTKPATAPTPVDPPVSAVLTTNHKPVRVSEDDDAPEEGA